MALASFSTRCLNKAIATGRPLTHDSSLSPSRRDACAQAPREEIRIDGVGCFGQTMLLGRRRRFTHVASVPSSVLLITKSDLRNLFASVELRTTASRMCRAVLRHQEAADRLQNMADVLRIALAERGDPNRAALLVQYCWRRWLQRQAAISDTLHQLTHSAAPAPGQTLRGNGDGKGMNAGAASVVQAQAGRPGPATLRDPAPLPPPMEEGSLGSVGEPRDGSTRSLLVAMARRLERLESVQAAQVEASSELKRLLECVLSATQTGAVDGAKPSGALVMGLGAGHRGSSSSPKKGANTSNTSPPPPREVAL